MAKRHPEVLFTSYMAFVLPTLYTRGSGNLTTKYGKTQINAASDEFTFAEEKKTLKPGKKVNTWEIDFC